MRISVPQPSLVLLIGPSGAGKSTFARKHFGRYEVLSSDYCRGLVSDDENEQAASGDAFDVLHFIAARRLRRHRVTVIDATNVVAYVRRPLLAMARRYGIAAVAVVFDLPEQVCLARDRMRRKRSVGPVVLRRQIEQLRRSLSTLEEEDFRRIYVLRTADDVETAVVMRQPA